MWTGPRVCSCNNVQYEPERTDSWQTVVCARRNPESPVFTLASGGEVECVENVSLDQREYHSLLVATSSSEISSILLNGPRPRWWAKPPCQPQWRWSICDTVMTQSVDKSCTLDLQLHDRKVRDFRQRQKHVRTHFLFVRKRQLSSRVRMDTAMAASGLGIRA